MSNTHFKIGDVVVCIMPDRHGALKVGGQYIIIGYSDLDPKCLKLHGVSGGWYPDRFLPLDQLNISELACEQLSRMIIQYAGEKTI